MNTSTSSKSFKKVFVVFKKVSRKSLHTRKTFSLVAAAQEPRKFKTSLEALHARHSVFNEMSEDY